MSATVAFQGMAAYTAQIAQIRANANEGSRKRTTETKEETFVSALQERYAEKTGETTSERRRIDADGALKETAGADKASGVSGARTITTAEMTMEEYKDYVGRQIDRLVQNRHPSQALRSVAINISEAGFEAMKNDPEYEAWVFDSLKANFDFNDPWANICGGGYGIHNFGATKEEYSGQSWYVGYQKGHGGDLFDSKTGDSFYKKRVDTSAAEKRTKEYWAEKDRKQRRAQETLDALWFSRKAAQARMQLLGQSNLFTDNLGMY